jgi:hypothetical protein
MDACYRLLLAWKKWMSYGEQLARLVAPRAFKPNLAPPSIQECTRPAGDTTPKESNKIYATFSPMLRIILGVGCYARR